MRRARSMSGSLELFNALDQLVANILHLLRAPALAGFAVGLGVQVDQQHAKGEDLLGWVEPLAGQIVQTDKGRNQQAFQETQYPKRLESQDRR